MRNLGLLLFDCLSNITEVAMFPNIIIFYHIIVNCIKYITYRILSGLKQCTRLIDHLVNLDCIK